MAGSASWYCDARADEILAARAGGDVDRSRALNRALDRYAEVCRRETPDLTLNEWKLVCDALRTRQHEPAASCHLVAAGVEDAIEFDGLAEKLNVDGPSLKEKLRELTYAQRVALVDAAERCIAAEARGETPTYPERKAAESDPGFGSSRVGTTFGRGDTAE